MNRARHGRGAFHSLGCGDALYVQRIPTVATVAMSRHCGGHAGAVRPARQQAAIARRCARHVRSTCRSVDVIAQDQFFGHDYFQLVDPDGNGITVCSSHTEELSV